MKTLPLSAAKAHFSELTEEVDRTHERLVVTKNGRDYVVVMSVEDLESMEATLELLADQAAQERVRQSEREIAKGDVLSPEESLSLLETLRGKTTK